VRQLFQQIMTAHTIVEEPRVYFHPYLFALSSPKRFLRISFPFPPRPAFAKFYAAMDNYGNFMAISIGRKEKAQGRGQRNVNKS